MPKIKRGKPMGDIPPDVVRRIMRRVSLASCDGDGVDGPCWVFDGYRDHKGYGQVKVGGTARWVHRVAYAAFVEDIGEGMQIDHLCCNPACCNPAHLEQVTITENRKRQSRRENKEPAPF